MSYEKLHKAASYLAGQCDGAIEQDGVGYNGTDTKFGHRIAAMAVTEWNEDIALTAGGILCKYAKQLEYGGIDIKAVIKEECPDLDGHVTNGSIREISRDAHTQAWKAEHARKNAPYIDIVGNWVMVYSSYEIRTDLKSAGFMFQKVRYGSKSWDAELNGTSAHTILGLGISLSDEQKIQLEAFPAEEYTAPEDKINITKEDKHLLLDVAYGVIPIAVIRAIPGRRWDGARKVNHISASPYIYRLMEEYNLTISPEARELIENTRAEYDKAQKEAEATTAASRATETDMIVALREHLRTYQQAGAAYAISREPGQGTLLGDEPGLGKTRQALSALETKQAYPALIVCPPKLTSVWRDEIRALLPNRTAYVYQGRNPGVTLPDADIHIVGYSVVESYIPYLPELGALVCDESHYIKNPKASRTSAILNITGHATRKGKYGNPEPIPGKMAPDALIMLLTGTPTVNRPNELVQQLIVLNVLSTTPKAANGVGWFLYRYCAKRDANGQIVKNFGHADFNGANHTDELHNWLRSTCMVARRKEDVLTELPPKIRAPQFMSLTPDAMRTYERLRKEGAEKAAESSAEALVYLNSLRAAIGTAIIQDGISWANDFLECGKSLIVFAVHKDTQKGLIEGLKESGHRVGQILGGESIDRIDEAKRAFQAGETNVIVCSFSSAREGNTLTAASDVLFVENGWNAETQNQAEDRAHRFGQPESCTMWYLIAQETISEWMYELVEAKRIITNMVNRGIKAEDEEEGIIVQLLDKLGVAHSWSKQA
jgi:SNF2 family DNA or RNA helicase